MEENHSIIEGFNFSTELFEDIEHSSLVATYFYSKISEKFRKDKMYYGERFVKEHPEVISKLAEAAILDMRLHRIETTIKKSVSQT